MEKEKNTKNINRIITVVESNSENIGKLFGVTEKNSKSIEKNRVAIEKNGRLIERNRKAIENNRKAIEKNREAIEINRKAILRNSKILDEHTIRLDNIEKQLEFLAKEVSNHSDRLDRIEQNMATKNDINDIKETLDKIVKLFGVKNQETTIVGHRVGQLEPKVEKNTVDILGLKTIVNTK